MNLHSALKKRNLLIIALFCSLIFMVQSGAVQANQGVYSPGITLLTPGSSTTLENTPGEAGIVATVITLGVGTLKVNLEKTDTFGELMSMFVIGFPSDPPFIPSFAITPGEISVSTDVTDALGGFGVIFIVTVVNSRHSYQSTLSLSLD